MSILARAPQRFTAVGASLGGYICFELVKLAPERITGLCLIGSAPDPDAPDLAARRHKLNRLAESGGYQDMWRRTINRFISPSRHHDKEFVKSLIDHVMESPPQNFVAHNAAAADRESYVDLMPQIKCPTLVIGGRDDMLTPLPVQQRMAESIPGAELKVIENAGHLPTFEEPLLTAKLIEDWLDMSEFENAAQPESAGNTRLYA